MDEFKSIADLVKEAHDNAVAHGFTENEPGTDIALMHSELSEALESLRDGDKIDQLLYQSPTGAIFDRQNITGEKLKPVGVPSELADTVIRILHFSGKHGIDLQRAIREKMAYNASRPFKHGKKF